MMLLNLDIAYQMLSVLSKLKLSNSSVFPTQRMSFIVYKALGEPAFFVMKKTDDKALKHDKIMILTREILI